MAATGERGWQNHVFGTRAIRAHRQAGMRGLPRLGLFAESGTVSPPRVSRASIQTPDAKPENALHSLRGSAAPSRTFRFEGCLKAPARTRMDTRPPARAIL